MKMARAEAQSLRQSLAQIPGERLFRDRAKSVRIGDLAGGTSLGGGLEKLSGKSVVVATGSQLTTALALIELDGVARRVAILPPDTDPDHFRAVATGAGIDAAVIDRSTAASAVCDVALPVICAEEIAAAERLPAPSRETEWVLLTSGTTGVPKMVAHSLAALTAPFAGKTTAGPVVWGTFYDIRRYGGLQIFLRAVLGGASLILSSAGEPIADHLERLGRHGVTHLSGTPSHWRRALMSPAIRAIAPRYVRLSGEIADQAILDGLRAVFPQASVGHAFASTEAGVAFEVDDGLAGFPKHFVGPSRNGVELKVVDGSLRIRSPRTASRYIGGETLPLRDSDGFVDTGDMVERRGSRYVFAGRRGGIINIGGLKVHPEEIEAVINRHPQVRMSLVRSKASPITGAVVIADVVLKSDFDRAGGDLHDEVKGDILKFCRDALPRHKVPAAISVVPALAVAATGKLARRYG
jgi:acyl-coenzyme A synthetase/AMP-(fatty) acid ligase